MVGARRRRRSACATRRSRHDTTEFLPRLRELVRHHDAPVYTITYYVQWLLMEHVHAGRLQDLDQRHRGRRAVTGYYDHHSLISRRCMATRRCTALRWRPGSEHVRRRSAIRTCQNPDLFVR